jgi:hypothetical protein
MDSAIGNTPRSKCAVIGIAISFAAALWLIAGESAALADELPASGRYQCIGPSGVMAELNFTVGPGNIYTTVKGFRGTMTVHPLSGNVLFHGAAPQSAYQGRYSAGPPAQVSFVTVADGVSKETGIVCPMR